MTRRFRGADYVIRYRRTGEASITVDGKQIKGTLLPDFRDGKTHSVEVTL
jgi:cellobiose phosphorylase